MASELQAETVRETAPFGGEALSVIVARCFAWCTVATLFVFCLNNYLNFWRDWPGAAVIFKAGADPRAWIQIALYVLGIAVAIAYVWRAPTRPLRADAASIYSITAYIVRAAFWAVLLIGLVDTVVSFLRVEGMLPELVGDKMATRWPSTSGGRASVASGCISRWLFWASLSPVQIAGSAFIGWRCSWSWRNC